MIPEVTNVKSFREALELAESMDLILIPYENERGMEATREALEELRPGMTAGIFIGPEGGFDAAEIEAARVRGARTVSLGRRILRTETAGLAALTLCMMRLELAEMESSVQKRACLPWNGDAGEERKELPTANISVGQEVSEEI